MRAVPEGDARHGAGEPGIQGPEVQDDPGQRGHQLRRREEVLSGAQAHHHADVPRSRQAGRGQIQRLQISGDLHHRRQREGAQALRR